MNPLAAIATSILLAPGVAEANDNNTSTEKVTVTPNGSQPSGKGPDDYFSGSVRIDPLFAAAEPSRTSGGQVTFDAGARSAWHTHPLGQTLIVTAGTGWVQQWGEEKKTIKPGDVVWCPPGVKHWHGATATNGMSHIAIQEMHEGKNVEWMEKVSDGQYLAPSATSAEPSVK